MNQAVFFTDESRVPFRPSPRSVEDSEETAENASASSRDTPPTQSNWLSQQGIWKGELQWDTHKTFPLTQNISDIHIKYRR